RHGDRTPGLSERGPAGQPLTSRPVTATHSPSLSDAARAVDLAQELVDRACAAVRGHGGIDANQVVAYDVAHAAAAVATARATLEYGERGEDEARIAAAFVADGVA